MRNLMRGAAIAASPIQSVSRRRLLTLAAGGSLAAVLAGCGTTGGGTTTTTTASNWVQAFQALAAEAQLIVPELTAVGLGGNTLTSVQAIVGDIESVLSGVSTAMTQTQGQSVLAQVEGYINNLAPLVLPFVSLIPGGSVIGLIVAALPAIEALVNFGISELSSVTAQLAASAPAPTVSAKLKGSVAAPTAQQYLNLLIQKAKAAKAAAKLHK